MVEKAWQTRETLPYEKQAVTQRAKLPDLDPKDPRKGERRDEVRRSTEMQERRYRRRTIGTARGCESSGQSFF